MVCMYVWQIFFEWDHLMIFDLGGLLSVLFLCIVFEVCNWRYESLDDFDHCLMKSSTSTTNNVDSQFHTMQLRTYPHTHTYTTSYSVGQWHTHTSTVFDLFENPVNFIRRAFSLCLVIVKYRIVQGDYGVSCYCCFPRLAKACVLNLNH